MEQSKSHIIALPFKEHMNHGYMAYRDSTTNHWLYSEFASIYKVNSKKDYIDPVKIRLVSIKGDIETTLIKDIIINNSDYKVLSTLKDAEKYASSKNKAIAEHTHELSVQEFIEHRTTY